MCGHRSTKAESTTQLKKKAIEVFNAWIRERDKEKPCISCGMARVEQAGHFYSAGHHNALRFNEDNVNGQCVRCNYYLSGNLNKYRVNLEKKIGAEKLARLDFIASVKTSTLFSNVKQFFDFCGIFIQF